VLFLTVLAGCDRGEGIAEEEGTSSTDPTPARAASAESAVVYLFTRSPRAIVPALAVEPDDLTIVSQLFEPLTRVDDDLTIVPGVASSWEVNGDATVHTFHLREDATFHDGSPVTAASFVRAWERVADRTAEPPSTSHHLLDLVDGIGAAREGGGLTGVRAVDDHTLEVTLRAPFVEFPAIASHPALAPLPTDDAQAGDFDRMPVGNGPLRMAEPWQPGQFIRLEPYPPHPNAPALDQVIFRIYDGDDALEAGYADLVRGTLDLAPVPEDSLEDARERFGRITGPGLSDGIRLATVFLAFNVEVPPFDDADVRRALAALIDRDAPASERSHLREPALALIPGVLPGYTPADCARCTFDPEGAAALLEESEIGSIELTYLAGSDHEPAVGALRDAVDDVLGEGTLELRPLERDAWLEAIRSGDAGFFVTGWIPEYPRASAYLEPLFHADRVGIDNLTRYVEPEVQDLLDAARAEIDEDARLELYREVEARVLEDVPIIPLHFYRQAMVASEDLDGVVVDPAGGLHLGGVGARGRS
jgi:oligopeptide transport system substrate-binding protein